MAMAISTSVRLKRRRMWINKIKTGAGCVDCGYNKNGVALHFDHKKRELKTKTVSQLMGSTFKNIFEEIRKCEVRCANCHAIKTVNEKEFISLHGNTGGYEKVVDKRKSKLAFDLWVAGATSTQITKETKITAHMTKKLIKEWTEEKEKVKEIALKNPFSGHPWHKQRWQEIVPPAPPPDNPEWKNLSPSEQATKRLERWEEWNRTKAVHGYSKKSTYREYFEQVYQEPLVLTGVYEHV